MNIIKKGKQFFGNGEDGLNPAIVFKKLDRNGDGKITEEDFFIAIKELGFGSVGEKVVRVIFEEIDTNKNGQLDFHEALACFDIIKKRFNRDKNSISTN